MVLLGRASLRDVPPSLASGLDDDVGPFRRRESSSLPEAPPEDLEEVEGVACSLVDVLGV